MANLLALGAPSFCVVASLRRNASCSSRMMPVKAAVSSREQGGGAPLEDLFTQLEKDFASKKRQGASELNGSNGYRRALEDAESVGSERVVHLQKWQLRKLKAALDLPKSQVKVKSLAGETGLDRRDVLIFLRNPPAELLEDVSESESESEPEEKEAEGGFGIDKAQIVVPAARMQRQGAGKEVEAGPRSWYGRKRIRQVHLDTFELVFRRSRRPTGAMIQNMVDLTHIPRKRILDWFENRRRQQQATGISNKKS